MLPDIKIKEFYLRYVFNAKRDIEKYKTILEEITNHKNVISDYIQDKVHKLYEDLNLDLTDYDEWVKSTFNPNKTLYKDTIKLLKTIKDNDNRATLLQIVKYTVKLKEEYDTKILIKIATKRETLTFKDYKALVHKYYMGVHKALLEGFGYKYQGGIGTLLINYYKLNYKTKPVIDYAETNKRKKELLEKGYKLYDEKEAAWYKARNIPYDGKEYRVYLDKKFYYEFDFINSDIFKKKELDYKRTEYVHLKLRGMSYQDMADQLCNNLDDIVNLNVDIKYKLNILLYKYPEKYLNFVRNAEQSKYKY